MNFTKEDIKTLKLALDLLVDKQQDTINHTELFNKLDKYILSLN